MVSPIDLLQALIRCPSVTPTEGGALQLVATHLADAGFVVDMPVFSEAGTPDVVNLYARLGTAEPCLVFAGHTDVVPPGDVAGWRHDPFGGAIENGILYGRGASDMKGGIAAAVAATLGFVAENGTPRGSIAFLLTGDEEGPAINGTAKLLAWAKARGERFNHCILGEPTNPDQLGDMIKIGRRGSLSGVLTVHGQQGHVAYPHRCQNPIPPLVTLMQALLSEPLDAGTEHFDPSNLEFTSVDVGNPSANVIPSVASARFNIRFNDLWSPETLAASIESRAAAAGVAVGYKFAFLPCNARAFVTTTGAFTTLVADAIEAETGRRPALSTTGGTSDARFIVDACPVVEFGLVGQTMHAVDECVAVADVEALAAIYRRVLDSYFAPSPA